MVVAILIVLLVLVTFYRLIHVWAYTLNFSEVQKFKWQKCSEKFSLAKRLSI